MDNLSRHFLEKGEITKNLEEEALCRTQIVLHLDHGMDYFTTRPIGNHMTVVNGDYKEAVEEFFNLLAK